MQNLEIYQSLWAMELRSPDRAERTYEQSFQMVADAVPVVERREEALQIRTWVRDIWRECEQEEASADMNKQSA